MGSEAAAAIVFALVTSAGVISAPWGATADWVVWAIVAMLGVGLVLNLITPSADERRMWAPTVAIMLACCVVVALA